MNWSNILVIGALIQVCFAALLSLGNDHEGTIECLLTALVLAVLAVAMRRSK